MTDAIAHHGPDGEGFYTNSFIGLGHQRDLSSIDTAIERVEDEMDYLLKSPANAMQLEHASLYKLSTDCKLYTSSICYFEYKLGSVDEAFEKKLFSNVTILNFSNQEAEIASNIFKELKSKNKRIEFRDILIASTAISNQMALATLNLNHFDRIDKLEIIDLSLYNVL